MRVLALVVALVAPAVLLAGPVSAAPPNLLANGGFEDDADLNGVPDGWTIVRDNVLRGLGTNQGVTTAVRERAVARTGAHALAVSDPSDQESIAVVSTPVPVLPGEILAATAWTRGLDLQMRVQVLGTSGNVLQTYTARFDRADAWKELNLTFVVPVGASHARVVFFSLYAERSAGFADDAALRLLAAQPVPAVNALVNPGFEYHLLGWTPVPCSGRTTVAVESPRLDGVRAAQVHDGCSLEQRVAASAGTAFVGSVQHHNTWGGGGGVPATASLHVRFLRADGTLLASTSTSLDGPTAGWVELQTSATAPEQTAYAVLRLTSSSWGYVQFDRAVLRTA